MNDTAKGMAEEVKGHAKRAAGKVLDDEELRREGEAQADKGREQRRAEAHQTRAEAAEARERLYQSMK